MTAKRSNGFGLIDRSQPLTFRFDGRPFAGFEGDTLASALIAAGVRVMGRGFKYHRPRGLWSAWADDPNAIMTIRQGTTELPNCQAASTYLESGMRARAVNAWPSAKYDVKGGLDLFHRWLGAGFYYKTFMWPDWHVFEPAIRKMAGLGAVSSEVIDHYVSDQSFDHCETLIIGGGVAGLAAARVAAEEGQDVCLVDDHRVLGGSAYQLSQIDGQAPRDWVSAQQAAVVAAGGRILTQTTAYGVYDHGMIGLVQNKAFADAPDRIRMRAGRVVLATGAYDRPVTFPENDRPGVMSLHAAAELLGRYGVLVGQKLAILANHSLAHSAQQLLESAGAQVDVVDPTGGDFAAFAGHQVTGLSVNGKRRVFDAVLTSGGFTPVVHLWRHAGGKLEWCDIRQAFLPGDAPNGMMAVGAANGTFDLDVAIAEGQNAGRGHDAPRANTTFQLTPLWPKPSGKGRQWIDFQHDVTLKDVVLAAQENYISVEHLKRYTTLGMASDQGKTANMAGLAAMATIQERPIPEVGTTTFRPPFVPIPIETYHGHHRGQHWHPLKRLPLESAHRSLGAALGEYGGWLRPGWYGDGIPSERIAAEVTAARTDAGLFDGSPLGKIEVMGPDAEAFVNFVYYNTTRTMTPGQLRYGFMLTEGGVVYDDGVLARLGPNHFVVSCSSSHVDGVRMHLEAWRQDGNNPDRIFIHDATQHWATIAVTGPKARDVLAGLGLDLPLGATAFPHMTMKETRWQGHGLRIARVSFSGDLSFEISVRSSAAPALWNALRVAGAAYGITPIGLEAMLVMRAEKGFIVIGKDTDGETMPHDLGFAVPRAKKKAAFLGDRSLHSDKANERSRKNLVGLRTQSGRLPTGAHIVTNGTSEGYVTSSYDSPTLQRPIALGLVANGRDRMGEMVDVWHLGTTCRAEICDPCFLDPEGERLHAE
ncbi:MAG: 2Fe-2S iron-sulfur cluster-binding protein [Pseudomonadota bacterium]